MPFRKSDLFYFYDSLSPYGSLRKSSLMRRHLGGLLLPKASKHAPVFNCEVPSRSSPLRCAGFGFGQMVPIPKKKIAPSLNP
jgi:hypothetical protein